MCCTMQPSERGLLLFRPPPGETVLPAGEGLLVAARFFGSAGHDGWDRDRTPGLVDRHECEICSVRVARGRGSISVRGDADTDLHGSTEGAVHGSLEGDDLAEAHRVM